MRRIALRAEKQQPVGQAIGMARNLTPPPRLSTQLSANAAPRRPSMRPEQHLTGNGSEPRSAVPDEARPLDTRESNSCIGLMPIDPTTSSSPKRTLHEVFDPHLPLAGIENGDVDNLWYFGLRRAVCIRSASAYEQRHGRSAEQESARIEALRRRGIQVHAALGWLPADLPQRAVPSPFAALRHALDRGEAEVVGPLGLSLSTPVEVDALEAQLRLAARFECPAYVRWDAWAQNVEATLFETIESSGVPFDSVVFVDVPIEDARQLAVAGRRFSVRVPPSGLAPESVSEFVETLSDTSVVPIFGTSLGANRVDVTALPRLHSEMSGAAAERVRRSEFRLVDGMAGSRASGV